jgi:hypothetical protein
MHEPLSPDEREFAEYAEEQAILFRARYNVPDEAAWPDETLDQAVADHGFPPLATLPDEPKGLMAELVDPEHVLTAQERERWRRGNAMHLLAHAMVHDGQRCGGCADWG